MSTRMVTSTSRRCELRIVDYRAARTRSSPGSEGRRPRCIPETLEFDAEALHAPEHTAARAHDPRALDSEHEAVKPTEKAGLESARLEHQPESLSARAARTDSTTPSTIW